MAQLTYSQDPAVAVEGLLFDVSFHNVIETGMATEAITFGRCVARVAGAIATDIPPDIQLPAAAADITSGVFCGIALHDVTLETTTTGWAIGDAVKVLRRGKVWMLAQDAVTLGGGVFARWQNGNEGRVRSDADGGNASQIPGAFYRSTTTGADEFAVVELNP